MKYSIALLFFGLIQFSCSSQPSSFNDQAAEFFDKQAHVSENSLQNLSETERCILSKVIDNDLDKINNWKSTLLWDAFEVRSYFAPYLRLNFHFVKALGTNEYFFVCLPELDKFLYDVEMNYD